MKRIEENSLLNKANFLYAAIGKVPAYYNRESFRLWNRNHQKFTACFDRIFLILAHEAMQISRSSNLSRAIESWNESQ